MAFSLENQKCVVCKAYLFPEDDTVYCPTCGAPHHRDCYNSLGACGMAEFHGTDKEYKKIEIIEDHEEATSENKKICLRCGKEQIKNSKFCPYCGAPNLDGDFKTIPFGNFTVIDGKTPIDDGVVAEDVAKVVMLNPLRYIEKFKKIRKGHSLSMNWAALLVPHGWFAYRKMYKASFLVASLKIIASILAFPFVLQITAVFSGVAPSYTELLKYFSENPNDVFSFASLLFFVSGFLNVFIHILCGLFADKVYKTQVIDVVKKIKASDDPEAALRKYGGLNTIGFLLAILAVEFLPQFISMFLG